MRYLYILTFTLLAACGLLAQTPQWQLPSEQVDLGNNPAEVSLMDMIGVNISKVATPIPTPYANVIRNARNFHPLDNDFLFDAPNGSFGKGRLMRDGIPNANLSGCDNAFANVANNCDMFSPQPLKYGFGVKDWYCRWEQVDNYSTMYATFEAIFPLSQTSCNSLVARTNRSYPNKFFSAAEMGGSPAAITQNAQQYTINYLTSMCPTDASKPCLVDVVELGNEPWGSIPGLPAFKAFSQGVANGFISYYGNNVSQWRCKISTSAVVASGIQPGCNFDDDRQFIGDVLDPALYPYISFISLHNYAFTHNGSEVTNCNEISENPESNQGLYLTLKNLLAWRNANLPNAEVNITEFGWPENSSENNNSTINLGQTRQTAYIMRAFLLANRYGINKAFYYNRTDTGEPQFANSGLFENNYQNPREIMDAIVKLNGKSLADKRFVSALTEANDTYGYLFGDADGTPTHLVAWLSEKYTDSNGGQPSVNGSYTNFTLPSGTILQAGANYYYLNANTASDGTIGAPGSSSRVRGQGGSVQVRLSGMPVVIPLADGVIQNCAGNGGTPASGCGVNLTLSGKTVTLTGTQSAGTRIITVRTPTWSEQYNLCNDYNSATACASGRSVTVTGTGTYVIDIQKANAPSCEFTISLPAGGGGGTVDQDGDGVCSDVDCDDTDPAKGAPQVPGTACNDGNSNTSNDVILADGCGCAGTTVNCGGGNTPVTGCEVTLGLSGQTVSLTSTQSSGTRIITVRTPTWSEQYNLCNDYNSATACVGNRTVTTTGTGTYVIDIQKANAPRCEFTISLPAGGGGGTVDQDGDGVCSDIDCDDNNPAKGAPQPAGTTCNDGNPNTSNDVIQSDGCTCAGEGTATTVTSCGVTVGINGQTVSFVSTTRSGDIIVKVRRSNWGEQYDLCNDYNPSTSCTAGRSVTVTGTGQYVIDIQGGSGSCSSFTINIGGNNRAVAWPNPDVNEPEVVIFPNPTSGELSLGGDLVPEITEVEVFDVNGRSLFQQRTNLNRIDLSAYPSGVYRVKLNTPDRSLHRKIVKR